MKYETVKKLPRWAWEAARLLEFVFCRQYVAPVCIPVSSPMPLSGEFSILFWKGGGVRYRWMGRQLLFRDEDGRWRSVEEVPEMVPPGRGLFCHSWSSIWR